MKLTGDVDEADKMVSADISQGSVPAFTPLNVQDQPGPSGTTRTSKRSLGKVGEQVKKKQKLTLKLAAPPKAAVGDESISEHPQVTGVVRTTQVTGMGEAVAGPSGTQHFGEVSLSGVASPESEDLDPHPRQDKGKGKASVGSAPGKAQLALSRRLLSGGPQAKFLDAFMKASKVLGEEMERELGDVSLVKLT